MARILIVDDEPDVANLFGISLRQAGHDVETAMSSDEALTAYELAKAERPFDIALLDIGMPFTNGLELAEKLRGIEPGLPLVFVSAYNEDFCAEHVARIGPNAYLIKPVTGPELAEVVDKALAGVAVQ